ncbi:MAG: cold shock domain-containing protein [Bacteroidetes bacterium]|nr:cold shock domain-containing protein [Bacteroidota bacterium]
MKNAIHENYLNSDNGGKDLKKVGKIKSFNSVKGYGYIYCLNDKKEYFVLRANLEDPMVHEMEVVVFDINNSNISNERVEAISVYQ